MHGAHTPRLEGFAREKSGVALMKVYGIYTILSIVVTTYFLGDFCKMRVDVIFVGSGEKPAMLVPKKR
jgi:CRISPR/Cas system-associated endonuclease Cas1